MISIAMTTYNGEKFVIKQLQSLLNQTLQPDEVIIHDDRSSDSTPELVQKFIKENNLTNWHFSVNEKNLGYKQNFYETIKQTSVDLIFLCDQDDIWLPNKIELMVAVFNRNKNIGVLNSAIDYIDKDDNLIPPNYRKNTSNGGLIKKNLKKGKLYSFPYKLFLIKNISPGCTMAFTKKIKDVYLKYPLMYYSHDWAINLLGSFTNNTYFLYVTTINYRLHENNTIGIDVNDAFDKENELSDKIINNNTVKKSTKEGKLSDHERYIKMNYNILFLVENYKETGNSFVKYRDAFVSYLNLRKEFLEKDFNSNLFFKLVLKYFYFYKRQVTLRGIISDMTFALKIHSKLVKIKNKLR